MCFNWARFRGPSTAFVLALTIAAASACAQQQPNSPPATPTASQTQPMQGQMNGQGGMPHGQSGPASADMMQAMQKMQQGMENVPSDLTADQQFVAMMIPHHQGAIDMARVELKYGKDATLRRLARNIIAAQEKQIMEMKHWQAKHPMH